MQQVEVGPTSSTATINNENLANETVSHNPDTLPPPPERADLLPESFLLSKDAELDWIDHYAFLNRNDSTKTTGSGSTHSIFYHINHPNSVNPSSQRYSCSSSTSNKKSNASIIIGLTKLTDKMTHHHNEAKNRRRTAAAANTRFFPKKAGATASFSSSSGRRKSATLVMEPTSPKVSCIGRVRSRKLDRNKCKKTVQQKSTTAEKSIKTTTTVRRSKSKRKSRKSGFWTSVRSIFHHGGRKQSNRKGGEDEAVSSSRVTARVGSVRRAGSVRRRGSSVASSSNLGGMKRFTSGRRSESWWSEEEEDVESVDDYGECSLDERPGLGSVMRFASGRRSDAWAAGDVKVEVAKSEPLDRGTATIWERRRRKEAAQPNGVEVERRWEGLQVGPLSV